MSELRRVENRYTIDLEDMEYILLEGVNTHLKRGMVFNRGGDERIQPHLDIINLIERDRHIGEAVYSLVKRQELFAVATFDLPIEAFESADRRLTYTPLRMGRHEGMQRKDEISFLDAIHRDLRDGLRPPERRYDGEVWAQVNASNLIERDIYEYARYGEEKTEDGMVYYIRRV